MNTIRFQDIDSKTGRRGASPGAVMLWLALFVVAILVALGFSGSFDSNEQVSGNDTHEVMIGDFVISVPASGELSANRLVEIRNPLETTGIITEIADEGTSVKEGDVILKFGVDNIEQRVKDDEDKLVDAQNRVVTSEQNLAIAMSTRDSDLEKADLSIEIAKLALKAWTEGEHIKRTQELDLALQTATINSDRLKNRFEEAKELVDQGFISRDEYERDRIAMIESAAKVKDATLDLDVYNRFTSKQDEKTKISDVDQAIAERARVNQRHEAELVTKNAEVESAKKKLESMQERVAELSEQLELCTVKAPTDGLVVYKTSMSGRWGRNDDNPPNVGTDVRPNDLVILLPDTSQMIANVKVSEALSGRIRSGQKALVYSEATPNKPINGTVQGVSVLAESGGWRDPNRRDYTVRIVLDVEPGMDLKPSMRCRSEILLGKVENAVTVPIQAIFRTGRVAYVYVPEGSGWAQQAVQLGRSSELSVEITDGIEVGDQVLLREPSASEILSKLDVESMTGPGGPPKGAGGSGGPPPGVAGSGGRPKGVTSTGGPPPGVGGKGGRPTGATSSGGPPPGVGGKGGRPGSGSTPTGS